MNANPYAAPQTIHSRFHLQELPVAMARGNEKERRDFREFSTEQLTQVMPKSRAIDKLQIFWLFAAAFATILAICWIADGQVILTDLLPKPKSCPWLFGYILIVLRFYAGVDRRGWMRLLIVAVDAALVAACGFCLLNPAFHQYFHSREIDPFTKYVFEIKPWYWVIMGVLSVITYFASKSAYAAFHAPELFSQHRYSHARLCQELDYRKEYGIE